MPARPQVRQESIEPELSLEIGMIVEDVGDIVGVAASVPTLQDVVNGVR